MPIILDGKKARNSYKIGLAKRIKTLGFSPRLAIIQVGDNRESGVYIEQKKKFAASIGATVDHIRFSMDATQAEVEQEIDALNSDASIQGIIVQLPVPAHMDKLALMNRIDPKKDVDGLSDASQAALARAAEGKGKPGFIPATAKGVLLLLDFYKIEVKGKKAVVIGRSRLVGHPTAELLKMRGANVEVCHSKTEDVPKIAETADIIVVAIGRPKLVDIEYIGALSTVVVDVGINNDDGRLVGDVHFDDVEPYVAAISPVPGGVGPMTVLSLFDNLVISAESLIS